MPGRNRLPFQALQYTKQEGSNTMSDQERIKDQILGGEAVVGIEFGSTRIKAELITTDNVPAAEGSWEWENRLDNGIWTYSLDDIWKGLQGCYADLAKNVEGRYGVKIHKLAAIGISAMMHGYLAFDSRDQLLVPFRTWRNTITEEAASRLTELFHYNIPQRWSIAHLYQAILNKEPHVRDISFVATLAAYVHWQLTGKKVIGVGDGSGMFPIDMQTGDFDAGMIRKFNELTAGENLGWKLPDIFPRNLKAGEDAGTLTERGAKLLDVSGNLEAGIPMCPPEGDAGTGMVATNSVAKRTGNTSAGTSCFGMIVLEKPLKNVYPEIDLVTTPVGDLVAMAHVNNCTSDLNAWVNIFYEFCGAMGISADRGQLFGILYRKALEGDKDCGGLLDYNYFSGEPISKVNEGRPLFVRTPDAKFNLANFMRVHLYASLSVLKVGMDLLLKNEGVKVDNMMGHGGLFKTKGVGQSILAAALNTPVTCMTTAGEGGAWGIALLAAYMVRGGGLSLAEWLNREVFAGAQGETIAPDPADVKGFDEYIARYTRGLPIEEAAIAGLKE